MALLALARPFLRRLCNPLKMSGHAAQRAGPVAAGASLEYLVYAKDSVKSDDKGFWDTKWLVLGDLLEQVTAYDVQEAIETWQEAGETARESLFALAANTAPSEA